MKTLSKGFSSKTRLYADDRRTFTLVNEKRKTYYYKLLQMNGYMGGGINRYLIIVEETNELLYDFTPC